MPAYNFKKQFAADVKSGKKRQTIRHRRKRRTRAGETLYLYTGQRTKRCRLLRAAICRKITGITIKGNAIVLEKIVPSGFCGSRIKETEMIRHGHAADRFARADGFKDSDEMIEWFKAAYDLPFSGVVIYW